MAPSRSPEWRDENKVVDYAAVLASIRDRCETARTLAWHQKNYRQIFVEMSRAVIELDVLKTDMATCWDRIHEIATKGEHHADTVDHPAS